MVKTYTYVNDLGARKEVDVYPLENGKYPVVLWCLENGELAGSGSLTPQELKDWLAHYSIRAELQQIDGEE